MKATILLQLLKWKRSYEPKLKTNTNMEQRDYEQQVSLAISDYDMGSNREKSNITLLKYWLK